MEDRGKKRGRMRKPLRHIFGWSFIVLGIIGLFLPFLQGILFIMVGVSILTPEIPLFHKIMTGLEKRYPAIFIRAKQFSHYLASRLGRKTPSHEQDLDGDPDDRQRG